MRASGLRTAARALAARSWDAIHVHTPFRAHQLGVRLKRQLGNVPQAYSHVALVNTARALSRTGSAIGRVHRDDPQHHGDYSAG